MGDSRMRFWFALFVLAVFCLGGATGMFVATRLGPPFHGPFVGPGPAGPRGLADRLQRELQLTDEQKSRIEAVLAARRDRLEQVQRDVRDRMEKEQRDLRDEIRQVLTPEQQQRFDRLEWIDRPGPFGRGRRGGPRPPD